MENYESLEISEKYQVLTRWFKSFNSSLDKSDIEYSTIMLELVLGVAVQDQQQINLIMQLEADDQMVVAAAISHVQREREEGVCLDSVLEDSRVSDSGNERNTVRLKSEKKRKKVNSVFWQKKNVFVFLKFFLSLKNPYFLCFWSFFFLFSAYFISSSSSDELNLSVNDHTNLQRIQSLENQLQHAQQQNHELELQTENLREKLSKIENAELVQSKSDQRTIQQKMATYQDLNEELQEENYRIEILKNEYAEKLTELTDDYRGLVEEAKQKNLVLMDVQLMKDEIDFLKQEVERSSLRGVCLEEVIEKMKRKIQGGFAKMSYFRVTTVFLGHFWLKKRDFRLFLGQNMLF